MVSGKVYHGVRKVYHGVKKVYHGVRKVYHGVRKVYQSSSNNQDLVWSETCLFLSAYDGQPNNHPKIVPSRFLLLDREVRGNLEIGNRIKIIFQIGWYALVKR